MSEKNLHGSEGGEASNGCVCPTSMLVERFTSFGNNFNGLFSGSPEKIQQTLET